MPVVRLKTIEGGVLMDEAVVRIYRNRTVRLTVGVRVTGVNGKSGTIMMLTKEKAYVKWDHPSRNGKPIARLFYSGIICGLPTLVIK